MKVDTFILLTLLFGSGAATASEKLTQAELMNIAKAETIKYQSDIIQAVKLGSGLIKLAP